MSNYLALVRRELGVYFVNPLAYIILTAFLFATGAIFYALMLSFQESRQPVHAGSLQFWIVQILTLVSPLITMRLVAEERSRGTLETMLTAPVSEWQFVLGKFTAALLFVGYLILPTVCHVVLAAKYGTVDFGATLAGYVGILLSVGAILAMGTFISSLCRNQMTAGVLTLIAALMLIAMDWVARFLPKGGVADVARAVFTYLNLLGHMESFVRGIVDTRPFAYFGSVTFLFLFLTVRVLESRRWA